MAEYIERKKLEEAFDNADPDICESYPDGYSDWGFSRENVRNVIRSVSAADAHPRKTRQDLFLEQWPNATRDSGGVVNICPKLLDVDISCTDEETERTGLCKPCDDCQYEFWMQEVE